MQAGALTFRLTVRGKAIHAAMKSDGVSAIDKYLLLHQAIQALDVRRHQLYSSPLYADPTNVAPISIGTVHGGEWHSTVAETVVAEGRCGIFPGETVDEVRRLLEETVQQAAAADPWLRSHPPHVEWFEGQFEAAETALDHPLIRTLAASHLLVHCRQPSITGVPYGADMRLYTNHGHMAAVLYGPGDVTLAHAADEYVPLAEVIAVTKTVALTVLAWCGGELRGAGRTLMMSMTTDVTPAHSPTGRRRSRGLPVHGAADPALPAQAPAPVARRSSPHRRTVAAAALPGAPTVRRRPRPVRDLRGAAGPTRDGARLPAG